MTMLLAAALAATPECPREESTQPDSSSRWAAHVALRVYQRVISPADGAGCSFYPSCSHYARQAIATHGVPLGTVLATERIMRAHGGWGYPRCRSGEREYLYAPLEATTWW